MKVKTHLDIIQQFGRPREARGNDEVWFLRKDSSHLFLTTKQNSLSGDKAKYSCFMPHNGN